MFQTKKNRKKNNVKENVKMNIVIRNEDEKDYRRVEEIAREAFWNLYFPGGQEHYIVHKMRSHPDFIKELAFVIEIDGMVQGAIFYTHSKVIGKENSEVQTISFGPVFIAPEYHRKGFGKELITYSIKEAKKLGYPAILTLGYPYHYEPYGFSGGKKYNISMEDGKFYIGLLVLPLYEGALDSVSGSVIFSDVLEATEEEVEEFDQSFPAKEKEYQESQDEYEAACAMLDQRIYSDVHTLKGKKFVASYSGGKDSILAIYRAIGLGMVPVSLIITYNTDLDRSWFHGLPKDLLDEVSASLGIPIQLVETSGKDYAIKFENELKAQREMGVQCCVFGDIDIEEHLQWCTSRCDAVGIEAFFPLWQEDRQTLVEEFIELGFIANISIVDTDRLNEEFLGQTLTQEVISSIALEGADACGENGEYHSFVSAGPLFLKPVSFCFGERVRKEQYAILPVHKK